MTSSGHYVDCRYFDGQTSLPRSVRLRIENGHAVVEGDGVARREPLARVGVSEPLRDAPRLVSFADGAFCEVQDHSGLDVLLSDTGFREPFVARLQRQWSMALLALGVCLGAGALSYFVALPWAAQRVADHLPADILDAAAERTLAALDTRFMQPSELSAARRESLVRSFERMTPPDGDKVPHRVVFRRSQALGPNAFALPSGTIVVTDMLVLLAANDDEVLAVLCHELGHVRRRHAMRQLLQSSVVGLVVSWYTGDASALLTALPVVLLEARYSRDHEREADDYAARMLRFNAMPVSLLALMLERLESFRRDHGEGDSERDGGAAAYLGSHPATSERIRTIRGD